MEVLDLRPARRAAGTLRLPGSKSISNRTLLLAALCDGATEVRSLLDADDTRVMREALAALGVRIEQIGDDALRVEGIGAGRGFPVKDAELFLGNAGTAFRPLTAALALADGRYRLSGVQRMHERPIGDLVAALEQAGASIAWAGGRPGFPPIAIAPRASKGAATIRVRGNVSSQFLSALLIALPWAGGGVRVEVDGDLISKPYVALTLGLIELFGVGIAREGWSAFAIAEGARYVSPGTVHVEGDASSASYFLAAGALGGGPVRVEGVGTASLQGDVAFTRVLREMGARVALGETWIEAAGSPPLDPFDLDMNAIPDAAMTAAVLALFARGPCRLRGIASWRVKETDRIAAMAAELRKFGAQVEEGADFLCVAPPRDFLVARALSSRDGASQPLNLAGASQPRPAPVSIDTYDDHRMAMAFSLASFGPVPVRINDPGCVSKTFPGYFDAFGKIVS